MFPYFSAKFRMSEGGYGDGKSGDKTNAIEKTMLQQTGNDSSHNCKKLGLLWEGYL